MASRIVFRGRREVELEAFEPVPLTDDAVRVRSLYSLMSTGTENIAFNQDFAPGTHWAAWVTMPFYPGYATVGVVEEVGRDVRTIAPGQRVFLAQPHASTIVASAALCRPLDDAVDPRDATWTMLASVAFVAARNAAYQVGDRVLVVGAGPIGQMSVRWARAAGVRSITVVDPMAPRLALAERGGATATLAGTVGSNVDAIREANGGELPSIVIDATGHPSAFAEALAVTGYRGRLVLVGDVGAPAEQHLTSDLLTRGITVIGTHAMHMGHVLGMTTGDPFASDDFLVGMAAASARFEAIFHSLVTTGRFALGGLITHEFPPGECDKAYAVANERRDETMGILFDWTRT